MSEIRVTYSGLIAFGSGLLSVITGLIFTLIVTRQLTQEEFGVWSLLAGLTAYAMIFEPIISYWTTREIARGEESGKTAFFASGLFSVGAVPIYLVIVLLFALQSNVNLNILIFAAMLIPVKFVRHVLASINLGYRVQTTAYSLLVFEISKISIGLITIVFLKMGLEGAILTVVLASIASIIFSSLRTIEKIKGTIKKKYIKKWIRFFWLPTYPRISELFVTSDVVLFAIIVGSVDHVAYWGVAIAISGIVLHASKISRAVYGKLLEGGKKEFFQDSITRVFFFIFPLVATAIVFAEPALFSLNPIYQVAFPIVIILTPVIFLRSLSGIFMQSLQGIEKIDTNENAKFSDYIKSKLFYLPTLKIIQQGGYFGILALSLILLEPQTESKFDLVVYWAFIALITQIPFTLFLYRLIRKDFAPKIDKQAVLKYLFLTIVTFGISYFLTDNFLEYEESIFVFLPNLLKFVILAFGSYLCLTYLVDKKTRKLINAIIKEVKR